jgi:hypothetical protein
MQDCVYPVEASRRHAPRQQRTRSPSIAIDDPETYRQTKTSESSDVQVYINLTPRPSTHQCVKAYMLDFGAR